MKRHSGINLGSHPFLEILEALISQEAGGDRIPGRSGVPFWAIGAGTASRKDAAASSAYADYADAHDGVAPRPDPMQQAEPRAEDIRRELGLRANFTIADLRRVRKSFAARNHPDRIGGPLRRLAEQRMKVANAIIDTEIARRRNATHATAAFRT